MVLSTGLDAQDLGKGMVLSTGLDAQDLGKGMVLFTGLGMHAMSSYNHLTPWIKFSWG